MSRRTSFHFSKDAMAQLNAIRIRTHIDNNTDIIRTAVHAYDDVARIAAAGCKMLVTDHEGGRWSYSPYLKLAYPGLKRDEIDAEAAAAAKTAVPTNYFFAGDDLVLIEALRKRSRLDSNGDTVRLALSAFKEMVLVLEAGDIMLVRDLAGCEYAFNPFQPFDMSQLQTLNTMAASDRARPFVQSIEQGEKAAPLPIPQHDVA